MALTKTRRFLKRKKKALGNKRLSVVLIGIGAVLMMMGDPNVAMFLTLAGGQMFLNSREELRSVRHPHAFRDTYPDYFRCSLDSFPENQYHDLFRFDKTAVKTIRNFFVRYCNIPEVVYVPYIANNKLRHYKFTIDELWLMTLMYITQPTRQLEIAVKFGRTIPEVCRGMAHFHELLYPISKHFLQNENQVWFSARVARKCARAIRKKGCPLVNCIGFIDGTLRPVSNPGVPWLQTELYNGHKRVAGFQWIGTGLPNGMCLLLLGPTVGRRHDAACAAIHGMYDKLDHLGTFPGLPAVFGSDSAFPTYWPVVPNYGQANTPAQARWNSRMSRVRISVEWMFNMVTQQFASVDWKRRHKVLASPVHQWYTNCVFLTNLHNINYPNLTSQFFNLPPPSYEEYFGIPRGSLR